MSPEFEDWLKRVLSLLFLLIFLIGIVNLMPSLKELLGGKVVVHVCGAVRKPGVYELPRGSRVRDAVQLAEPLFSSDVHKLNLAKKLRDGDKIRVPFKSEGKVNLNEASEEELMKLPGITRTLAKRIVLYRERYGPITSLQELLKVKGVNLKLLREIEPYVEL